MLQIAGFVRHRPIYTGELFMDLEWLRSTAKDRAEVITLNRPRLLDGFRGTHPRFSLIQARRRRIDVQRLSAERNHP